MSFVEPFAATKNAAIVLAVSHSQEVVMDKLLTRKQVAEFLGIEPGTLARWKWAGKDGPPSVKVGTRSIRYRQSDVESWMSKAGKSSETKTGPQSVQLKTPECIGVDATLYLRFNDVRDALKRAGVHWVVVS